MSTRVSYIWTYSRITFSTPNFPHFFLLTLCDHLFRKRCSLHHFIHDFVKHHFLDSLTFDCNKKLENATKCQFLLVVRGGEREERRERVWRGDNLLVYSFYILYCCEKETVERGK